MMHPANRGRTCRKPLGLPFAVHAPDRATVPLWREDRDARFEPAGWEDVLGTLAGRMRAIVDAARPRRRRVLHLRSAAHRGLLRGQQARQGLSRDQQRRLQLAPVHVLGRGRLQRRVRVRRPAAGLCGHRARRLLPAARHEHRRVSSDPVEPDPRPPGRGRVHHLRRPARHADRALVGPASAGAAGHRPRAAQRAAARGRPRRARRRVVHRAPHERLGGDARRGPGMVARSAPPRSAGSRPSSSSRRRGALRPPARPWRCGRWAPTSPPSAR